MRKLRVNKSAPSDNLSNHHSFEPNLAYTPLISERGSDYGSAYYYCAARPGVFRFVMGYWRLMDWNMSARQLVVLLKSIWISA